MQADHQYDIALSFAGEDRGVARQLASLLQRQGLRVFFDEFESETLLGKSLSKHLHHVYTESARYCIPIISRAYVRKDFTRHEFHSALTRALKERQEYILPLRLDDSLVEGLPDDIAYLDLRRYDIADVASVVIRKVRAEKPGQPVAKGPRKPFFSLNAIEAPISADVVALGNRTNSLLAVSNEKGVFVSTDFGNSASHVRGINPASKILFLSFSFDDRFLAVVSKADVDIVDRITGEIISVLRDIVRDEKIKSLGYGETFSWSPARYEFAWVAKAILAPERKIVLFASHDQLRGGFFQAARIGYEKLILPGPSHVVWQPSGDRLGIVLGGGGEHSLIYVRRETPYALTQVHGLASGSRYFWLTDFKLLRVSGGAGEYALWIDDMRDQQGFLLSRVGEYPTVFPTSDGRAILYESQSSENDEERTVWKVVVIGRSGDAVVAEVNNDSNFYDRISISWSGDSSKLAFAFNGTLHVVNIPLFM